MAGEDAIVPSWVWRLVPWRVELGLVVACVLAWDLSPVVFAVGAVAVRCWPAGRRVVWDRLEIARATRRWRGAVAGCKRRLAPGRVLEVVDTPIGERLTVKVGRGAAAADVVAIGGHLENAYHAASVTVRDRGRGIVDVDFERRAVLVASTIPPVAVGDSWAGCEVGVDAGGRPLVVKWAQRNAVVGGIPGSGKSGVVQSIVSHFAADSASPLVLLDGKQGVELGAWEDVADRFAEDADGALAALEYAHGLIDERYAVLREIGERDPFELRDRGYAMGLVVVDELTTFLRGSRRKEITVELEHIAARGRAAGVVLILATQKPDETSIPTNIRDLLGYRFGLKATTPQASDVALGPGWAKLGCDSSRLPDRPGLGYALVGGSEPVMFRAHYVSTETLKANAQEAASKRSALPSGDSVAEAAECAETAV